MTYLIIIPAFNAAETIADVLGRFNGHREHLVVVDDGSTDATPDIVRRLGGEVLGHDRNRGVGAALRTGIQYAHSCGFEQLVTLDADGQHAPEQVEEFLHTLARNDLVIGSRFLLEGNGVHDTKLAANLLAALIINDAFGLQLTDVACGYRAFRYPSQLPSSDDWGFLYEHLIRSLAEGRRVTAVPVPAVYRPSEPWATRALEIEGFLAALRRHAPNAGVATNVGTAHSAVQGRRDFDYEVSGQVFHCFYAGARDSYLVQTDMTAARAILSELRKATGFPRSQDGGGQAVRGSIPAAGPSIPG